ncbi:MAG: Prolipoprotein diacylglyceryl transferase [Betaproteobacteria bacterium ADurb.Bin341]|nr:MAG: Prolipoprotein diacylglyceryl transferase [Betaproteobacteria bacterium ADurb.Bin341]HOG02108.1 prolipoprotein diacylglyceryl transferase [Clostridia bacterium]
MNRFAFENVFGIEGFNIAWYGIIIACGMFLGAVLAVYRAKKRGFKPDLILDFLLVAIPSAMIGARLYYVVFEWENYAGDLSKVLAINQGGLAIYGGVIGGIVAAVIFCKVKKFPILTLLDLAVPSLILGQAIGRWGNFVNQEAFGNIVTNPALQFFPVAVYIEEMGEWHQATFFYESAWNFALVCVVLLLSRRKVRDGVLLSGYFIGYGIGRFLIEGLRTDSLYIVPGVRVSQMLSLLLIAVGIAPMILIRKGVLKTPPHEGGYLRKQE